MAGKEWFGTDRTTLTWYPSIAADKCTQCGLCLLTCGAGVFGFSSSKKTYSVINPGNCTLGCTTCGKVCPEDAISFPEESRTFMHNIIKKGKIFTKVKQALQVRLEKFPDHELHGTGVVR
uniref:Ferredoxin family protein n=1 Tax=Gracilinema caldarium TaxID=215591 RepID=A0A7C3EJP2_9SPIR